MGYLFTPSQSEKDNNLINSTLETLKTTNLLKQTKDKANNANLNAQSNNIPQNTISQNSALNAKNTQNLQTQDLGKSISFASNVLKQQTQQIPQTTQNNIQTNQQQSQKPNFYKNIALSSDEDFKPQGSIQEPIQATQTQTKPKKTRLQQERENIGYERLYNQSAYTRNNAAFLEKPYEFDNYKAAMQAKHNLYNNYDDNANVDSIIEQHRLLDKSVAALETAKKNLGKNSKEYKNILNSYMQSSPILRDNNITDYASLKNFYDNGGVVKGHEVAIKQVANANLDIDVDDKGLESSNTKKLDSISDFNTQGNLATYKVTLDDNVVKGAFKNALGMYGAGNTENQKEKYKRGFNIQNGLNLATLENIEDLALKDMEETNKGKWAKSKGKVNKQDIYNTYADMLKGDYALTKDSAEATKEAWKKGNYVESVYNAGKTVVSAGLDTAAATLKDSVNMLNPTKIGHDAFSARMNEHHLFKSMNEGKDLANTGLLTKGSDTNQFNQFINNMDTLVNADSKTSEAWDKAKLALFKYFKESNSTKKEALKAEYAKELAKTKDAFLDSPAYRLADNDLIDLTQTIKNQSDYGRFFYNLAKNPNQKKEVAQKYLNDLKNVLKESHPRFKDIEEVALDKEGELLVRFNDEKGFQSTRQGFLSEFMHSLHDEFNENAMSVAGAIAGAKMGAKGATLQQKVLGGIGGGVIGGAIGAGAGALIDEKLNALKTKYSNDDLGLKRANEAMLFNIAGDAILGGGAYAIKKGYNAFTNLTKLSDTNLVQNTVKNTQKLASGNINAVENFLAKNALSIEEREAIRKNAEAMFLNGKSLNEFKADSSIPKLNRLKQAWQYEKFINKESISKGKAYLEDISKEFEKFQTTSMESNRPIMDVMQDMFEGKATRNEREKFLRFVSQNEGLSSVISSLLAKNPTLALNFGNFIDKRAKNALKSIESQALTQRMFKDLDSEYAKGLKDNYGRVEFRVIDTLKDVDFSHVGEEIQNILKNLKDSIPHVTNSAQTINAMLGKLASRLDSGILEASDLLEIRKYYNDILRSKDFKNASFKHLQDINANIDNALKQALDGLEFASGIKTSKIWNDYKNINKEYTQYAKFKDSDFYKDVVKSKKRDKDLSDDSFNFAILKQAKRKDGFNNKVFEKIAKNTDKNLQAQAIKELIRKNAINPNGELQAIKWKELVEDLASIEHSITDTSLRNLISNFKEANKLYHADYEFMQAIQRSVGSKPASVLISSANGLFGRTLLLFYNFLHKTISRYAGALNDNLAHQSLEHQLSLALRYARDTKDFANASIESLSKNEFKDDKEAIRVVKELSYWREKLNKDFTNSMLDVKQAYLIETNTKVKDEIATAILEYKPKLKDFEEIIDAEIIEPSRALSYHDRGLDYLDKGLSYHDSDTATKQMYKKAPEGTTNENITKESTLYDDYTKDFIKKNLVQLKKDINEVENLLQQNSSKALEYKLQENYASSITQAGNLLGYVENMAKELANNPSQLKDLAKLRSSIKDYMKMPYSIIVDSKGNALPLTDSAIRAAILYYFFEELNRLSKRMLNKSILGLDKPILDNEIRLLTYEAKALDKQLIDALYEKTNDIASKHKELKDTKLLTMETKHDNSDFSKNGSNNTRNTSSDKRDFSSISFGNSDASGILASRERDRGDGSQTKSKERLNTHNLTREYEVITDKNALINNLGILKEHAEAIPPTLDAQSFLKTLDNVKNKENFLKHLLARDNAAYRLAYLNLVEPTLKRPDITLTMLPDKKEYIKAFKGNDNSLFYLLVTKNNDKTLITGIPDVKERYIKSEIDKADIIHSFVPLNRQTAKAVSGLQYNPTTKQETKQDLNKENGKLEYDPIFNKPALELHVQNEIGDTNQLMQGSNSTIKQNNSVLYDTDFNLKENTHEREHTKQSKQEAAATKSKSIEGDYRAGDKGLDNSKAGSPYELHERERLNQGDNQSSNANGFKSQEIPQEKPQDDVRGVKNIREETSNRSLNTKSSDDILREEERHNARIGFEQDNNIGFIAGGNSSESRPSPRLRNRNVSLIHKDAKQEGFTQEPTLQALSTKDIIKQLPHITTQDNKSIGELRKELYNALSPIFHTVITNKETGLSGVVTLNEAKKMMSQKAITKSVANGFNTNEHIEAAKHLKELFTTAQKGISHEDYKNNPNILQVHRFNKEVNINDKEANAQITLFEKIEGNNKIYTIELQELQPTALNTQAKSEAVADKAQSATTTPTEVAPIAKSDKPNSTTKKPTKAIIKEAKEQGLSVKETQKLVDENRQPTLKESKELQAIKQKTMQAVNRYAQSKEFKALSKDKQEAILSLKEIVPAKMPDLSNFFVKLINGARQNPHIILEVERDGQLHKEYIKAYRHEGSEDVHYMFITHGEISTAMTTAQINESGMTTTQINEVIEYIAKSNKAEALERIQQTATPLQSNLSSQGAKDIIQKESTKPTTKKPTKAIIKEAKEQGLSVKETQKLVDENNAKQGILNKTQARKDTKEELNPKPLAKLGRNTSQQGNANLTQTTASKSIAPIEKHSDNSTRKKPKEIKEVEKEADNFQSSSNPAGLLNPEEKAFIQRSFKQQDLEDISSSKELYDLNMNSLRLLKDALENPRPLNDSEKQILSNFRGFGRASDTLFKIIKQKGEAYDELVSLLDSLSERLSEKITPLDLMKRSSDAFYTPLPIIREMVGLAQSFGLKEGHYVLEPSIGVGRFLSELSNKGLNIHGIEIDSISAKLASLIYPNADIDKSGFEKSKYAINNFYDLVIGNPPYGNFIIKDDNFRASAHNYFMKKGIDSLAENGISIQIVTHNFLDAKDKFTREAIASNAAFIGGVRLPNTAFKDAKVTTDILVFRKAGKGEKLDSSWIETSDFNGLQVSKYFLDNPQNVLGNMQIGKGQFGYVIEVVNKDFDINSLRLQDYIKRDNLAFHRGNYGNLEFNLYKNLLREAEKANKAKEFIRNSPLEIKDNKIYRRGDIVDAEKELKWLTTWSDSTIKQRVEALKEMLPDINNVRETLSKLQDAERYGLEYEEIEGLRKDLNTQYEKLVGKNSSFYNKNGAISQKFKAYEILDDESFELFALENKAIVKNDKVVGAEKSDIFTKRVNYPYIAPQSASNLDEAVAITLNEVGSYDYERIAELLGKDMESVKKDLLDSKMHYLDSNGEHITKEEFLSGDVKTRLESFHDENGLPKFSDDEDIRKYQEVAYNDLKEVIPDDIELPLVSIPLGANWLDKNITDSFLKDVLESNIQTSYTHGVGWDFTYGREIITGRDLTIATSDEFKKQTGLSAIDGAYYLKDMFNNKTLKVQKTIIIDRKPVTYTDPVASQSLESMKKQLQAEFKNFILDNDSFTDIAQKQYNDTFNRIVPRKYNGSHIKLIGKHEDISMREHQNNAIFRFLQENSTLLAHDVGTGKSYTMVASSIEAKRIGIIKKPMIVVPNNVAPQLAAEARRLYPNAKIQLVQAVSKRDKNKQLARIKNNDNDITITTYTAFTNMNVSAEYFERYVEDELKLINKIIDELQNNKNTPKKTMDKMIKARTELTAKLNSYIQEIKNERQNLFFDDLDIDSLMFDEAHYLKNLPIQTAQKDVRGIGKANSQRALDAMMKITQVFDNDKGKVLFATGTPITNFISDVYVLQKFLDPKGLKSLGIEYFDEWSKQFAGAVTEFELKSTGDYKLTTRLRDFTNLPELKNQYLKFADVVTKDDMKKAAEKQGIKNLEPEIERINVLIERSPAQAEFMEEVKERAEDIARDPRAAMRKGADNHLKLISDSNKASLDMRLIDPRHKRDENGKVAQSANNIYENYKQYDNVKGTQLVFLDLSVPKKKPNPKKLEKLQDELQTLQKKIDSYEEVGDFEKVEDLGKKKEDLEIELEQYKSGFSVYDDLKEVLIQKGIKEDEIAFIHDYQSEGNSKWSKNALREKINSGDIRVLIGSTGKMGAGSNFQERLVALHHLDLNWTPANMEQREGRIIRQGNILIDKIPNFKAKIYTYVTKEMSDALMLQTLEQKQKIIKQITNPYLKDRFIEDTSEDNLHGRLKAMASPNAEQHLEFMNLDKEISQLNNMIATSKSIVYNNTRKVKEAQEAIKLNKEKLEYLHSFLEATKDNNTLQVESKSFDLNDKPKPKSKKQDGKPKEKSTKELANEALTLKIQEFAKSSDKIGILGRFKGKNLLAHKTYAGVDLFVGEDLKTSLPLNTIGLKQAYYDEPDYIMRLNNGYTRLEKGDYESSLKGNIHEKENILLRANKVLQKESANDLRQVQKLLEEKTYRQKELSIFLKTAGAEDHEFMEALLGKDYEDIIRDKIEKEKLGISDEDIDYKLEANDKDKIEKEESSDSANEIKRNPIALDDDKMQKIKDFFYRNSNDSQSRELLNNVLPVAKSLGVKIELVKGMDGALGMYKSKENIVLIDTSRKGQVQARALLHELIHSTTSRALRKPELLNATQKQAVRDIQGIYKELVSKSEKLGLEKYHNKKGDYGLTNAHEMIAELSNPIFREKLKQINLFEKIINAITRLFIGTKEALGFGDKAIKGQNNAYDRLKKALYDIIDNYDDGFSRAYEQILKDVELRSQALKKENNYDKYSKPNIKEVSREL